MTDVTDTPTPTADDAAPATAPPAPSFADYPIHADIVDALAEHDITSPFPIQAMTLPVALSGHDIIGQAKTGTGKTLGFGIPILNRVVSPRDEAFSSMPAAGKPQALAVAPTRELAVQVAGDLEGGSAASGSSPSTVAGPTSRRSRHCSVVSRSSSAPRDASSTSRSRATSTWATPASSSSTRPTRCWTSASSRTSRSCCP